MKVDSNSRIFMENASVREALSVISAVEDQGFPFDRNAAVYEKARHVWHGTSGGARRTARKAARRTARKVAVAQRRLLINLLAGPVEISRLDWESSGYSHYSESWLYNLRIDGVSTPLLIWEPRNYRGSCHVGLAARDAAGPITNIGVSVATAAALKASWKDYIDAYYAEQERQYQERTAALP
jgi:hypothetical protein